MPTVRAAQVFEGSSPHTRGARRRGAARHARRRIIPAYAGSTTRRYQPLQRGPDHPRIRGEHRILPPDQTLPGGSSPHTRGALRSLSPSPGGTDHPRIRGEHRGAPAQEGDETGSSPHTRGAQRRFEWLHTLWGIIPAYAGSTNGPSSRPPPKADHPRIRGEHDGNRPASQEREGSSPHTRGAPTHPRHPRHNQRIIPAYAGSTPAPGRIENPGADHPRIRGEHA